MLHEFLHLVIAFYGFPEGFCRLVEGIYFLNFAYIDIAGQLIFLLTYLSGVLQGCPLSGMLFTICLDPFLIWLNAVIKDDALLRACADDLGAALGKLEVLCRVEPVFQVAKDIAGLTLKPSKCVIVPLVGSLNEDIAAMYSDWMATHVPNWRNFKIQEAGKYLGFWLGPKAANKLWIGPFSKYKERTKAIAGANTAAASTAIAYNRDAITVLGYHAQLLFFPSSFYKEERVSFSRLLKIPHNSLGNALPFRWAELGGIIFTSMKVLNFSAMFRTAFKTIPTWRDSYTSLRETAEHHLPFVQIMAGKLCPSFWDTTPIIDNLQSASKGFVDLPGQTIPEGLLRNLRDGPNVQKQIGIKLLPNLHPTPFPKVFKERLHSMLPEFSQELQTVNWQRVLHELAQSKRCFATMCCIKTWCKAWTTSARMHDGTQMSCLFGCKDCGDCEEHYLRCDRLWNPIFQTLNIAPYNDLLQRLAVEGPSKKRFLTLAVVFVVYHKHRAQARQHGAQVISNAADVRNSARAAASLVQF